MRARFMLFGRLSSASSSCLQSELASSLAGQRAKLTRQRVGLTKGLADQRADLAIQRADLALLISNETRTMIFALIAAFVAISSLALFR